MILLYSTHCPRCNVLEDKLNRKSVSFSIVDNEEEILKKGIKAVPVLQLEDGTLLEFAQANQWINNY